MLWAYIVAFEENSSPPVITAAMNADQVTGRTLRVVCATLRSRAATPMSRKSTKAIEPTTTLKASTWKHSIHGNNSSPSRIAVAMRESCSNCQKGSNKSARLKVGDPPPCENDGDPQGQ